MNLALRRPTRASMIPSPHRLVDHPIRRMDNPTMLQLVIRWPWLATMGTGGPSHGRPRVTQVEHGWALSHLSFLTLQKSHDVCGCRCLCAGGSFERLSAEWFKCGLAVPLNSTGVFRFIAFGQAWRSRWSFLCEKLQSGQSADVVCQFGFSRKYLA